TLAGLLLLRLPQARPTTGGHPHQRTRSALRDLPYLLAAQVSGLTRLGDTVLTVGIPLWVVARTAAPRGLAAWLLIANTLLIVTAQAGVTRRASSPVGAGQIQRWAFAALALACLVISPSGRLAEWAAAGVLLAGTVLLTFGEMWGEGAWWSLRYTLAPDHAQGAYGGVVALGQAVPNVLGPVLVTSLAIGLGARGWVILAAIFLGCGAVNRWPIAWAAAHLAAAAPADPIPEPAAKTAVP